MNYKKRLSKSIFLSSMLHKTDAKFCIECGKGADMVQLGALLAAADDQFKNEREDEPDIFLPQKEEDMTTCLKKEIDLIKNNLKDTVIALNIGIFDLEAGLKAARALKKAHGDILELNVHGAWNDTEKMGYLRGMALPEHQHTLIDWTHKLADEGPLIIKFHGTISIDFCDLIKKLNATGLIGYHFNIRTGKDQPRYELIKEIKPHIKGLLFTSGDIHRAEQAEKLFNLGVDGVGFARPVLKDKKFISSFRKAII